MQDEKDIPKISISHGYGTNCNDVNYWIRNRASSSPTKIKNRLSPCIMTFKVFKIYRRSIRLVHFVEHFNRHACYGARKRTIPNTGKITGLVWPVLEVFVPSQRVPVNPALQVHLNCESSSCDAIQVPPFKQSESSQGSSAKGNIHAEVTSLRLNDLS